MAANYTKIKSNKSFFFPWIFLYLYQDQHYCINLSTYTIVSQVKNDINDKLSVADQ